MYKRKNETIPRGKIFKSTPAPPPPRIVASPEGILTQEEAFSDKPSGGSITPLADRSSR